MTAAVPDWAVDLGQWCGVVLAVCAVLGLVGKWFVMPAIKEAIRTDFADAIGTVVAEKLAPTLDRLAAVEAVVAVLNQDLRRHMAEEDERSKRP